MQGFYAWSQKAYFGPCFSTHYQRMRRNFCGLQCNGKQFMQICALFIIFFGDAHPWSHRIRLYIFRLFGGHHFIFRILPHHHGSRCRNLKAPFHGKCASIIVDVNDGNQGSWKRRQGLWACHNSNRLRPMRQRWLLCIELVGIQRRLPPLHRCVIHNTVNKAPRIRRWTASSQMMFRWEQMVALIATHLGARPWMLAKFARLPLLRENAVAELLEIFLPVNWNSAIPDWEKRNNILISKYTQAIKNLKKQTWELWCGFGTSHPL